LFTICNNSSSVDITALFANPFEKAMIPVPYAEALAGYQV